MSSTVWAFIGLYGGLFCAIAAILFSRKKLRKQRGLDERYYEIERKSRVASWWITTIGLYIMYTFVIMDIAIKAIHVISFLFIIHIVGWSLSYFYYNLKT